MKKLKILFFTIIGLIILFFISLFISKSLSYKESDFNIPNDFLNSKHYDKEYNSKENGFLEFEKLLIYLEKNIITLEKYDTISKCYKRYGENIGECTYLKNDKLEKLKLKSEIINKITKEKFKGLQEYIRRQNKGEIEKADTIISSLNINEIEIKEFNKYNDYIKLLNENFINNNINYTKEIEKINTFISLYTKKIEKSNYITSYNKYDIYIYHPYTNLFKIYRINYFLITEYIKKGDIDKINKLLISNQKLINILSKNGDFDLMGNLTILTLARIHFESVELVINNNSLSDSNNNELIEIISKFNLSNKLIENGMKREYLFLKNVFEAMFNDLENSNIKNMLFWDQDEHLLLLKKVHFEIINNKGINTFKTNYNISNYIGRLLNTAYDDINYTHQFEREVEMKNKKEEIIEKLKK